MSEPGPVPNPFEGMFGDLARMLGSLGTGGPVNWDVARQFAQWVATSGQAEPNVEPVDRIGLEELLRVADLHVAEATGLSTSITGRVLTVAAVTRGEWARRALDAYRPLFDALAGSLAAAGADGDPDPDPATQLLGNLPQVLAPFLMAALAGSMAGHLAQRAFGGYDLPLPRPAADEVLVVPANVDAFAREWSLPPADLRLWVLLHEVVHHAVLGLPHVRSRLEAALLEYASGFERDPEGLEAKLSDIDPADPESFQKVLGDPELLLGAMQSDRQRRLLPQLAALTQVIEGYADHVMDTVGTRLVGSSGMLGEAVRRRRVEDAAGTRYAGRMFGLELGQAAYGRGAAFVRGIVERAGEDALARLWASERELPTPAELDAPGLWLERIDLPR